MANKINFTKHALDAFTCDAEQDRSYAYDLKTPGLAFCCTAAGHRSFYLYRRVAGRPHRIRLGGYPEITIEQARIQAARMNGEIASGGNPQLAKRLGRAESTVGDLLAHYIEAHAKLHKKTWKDDEVQFERYLETWRNRKLSTIRKSDVQAMHAKVGRENGTYAANRMLALISSMWNRAAEVGFRGENPAKGIKKFKEKSRERFLQAEEFPRFFKAVQAELNTTIRDFVLISLLTGARRANVQAMRWDEISFERAVWIIPDTKAGTPLALPLSENAMAILKDRKDNDSEWVFPSHGRAGHLMEPKAAWAAILKRAGITDLRLHDLRRTLGSWQAAAGASLPIIGKSLGHKNQSTTAIYARLNLDPVRVSVNAATVAMIAAGSVAEDPKQLEATADGKAIS
jgi:integrase